MAKYSFGDAVRRFYQNYGTVDGRALRSEYWWVQLFQITIYLALGVMIVTAAGGIEPLEDEAQLAQMGPFVWIPIIAIVIFALGNFVPNITLAVRRLHDLGQSGWLHLGFMLGGLIPVIGFFISLGELIWFAMPGTDGPNKYGPDPLGNGYESFD